MVAHESSLLVPTDELIIELSACDCMSEIEADKIFKWLTPRVISWSGDLTNIETRLTQISFVRRGIYFYVDDIFWAVCISGTRVLQATN